MENSKEQASTAKKRGNPKGTLPPNAGKGRKPGTPNRVTKALKDMILGALNEKGGQEYLAKQADENPVAFMALLGKVLPTTLAGDPNAPLSVAVITRRVIDPAPK